MGKNNKTLNVSFTSFYYFGGAILGALMGTYFKFPLFFLVIPVALAIFKKPKVAVFLLIFILSNMAFISNIDFSNKSVEFVGTVKAVQNGSSILRLSFFDGKRWRRMGVDVLIYEEEKLGTIVYFIGQLKRKGAYPIYYAKTDYCATVTNYESLSARVFEHFERYRNFTNNVDPFYQNLFGANSRDENFAKSGLLHIFCVSGMHVSLLYLFTAYVIGMFTYRKWLRVMLSLTFPTIFVIGSGLNLPSLRALIMLYFAALLRLADYKVNAVNIVSLVGTGMVLFNPEIVYSLSFYMTFFATLGVLISENNFLSNIGGFLGSAPYVSLINPVNPFSIIATMLVSIPVQVLLFGLTTSYVLFSCNLFFLSAFILYALKPFAWFIQIVANWFAKLPTIPQHPIITIAFAMSFILYMGFVFELKKQKQESS
ncbi:ComEC/Rec2 family competence protein [Fervidobacterium islandicum]|uniref:ComEC/Rec2 family competence protein n=1 Tax=Fervidobacterium islandicum TaxID=2423 RepID=A0AAI8GCW5_FERIS|nr:ComEC/Rec2 family competence protein [Fervidobacterium islandicum]AMW32633.1 ComEC/Rec2 family competence protein [Fervidobacterium islandicum]